MKGKSDSRANGLFYALNFLLSVGSDNPKSFVMRFLVFAIDLGDRLSGLFSKAIVRLRKRIRLGYLSGFTFFRLSSGSSRVEENNIVVPGSRSAY